MIAQIYRSINNLYTAMSEGKIYTLRIKGKVLDIANFEYNPIAVGDFVEFTPYSDNEGLITKRLDRTSSFTRWNAKLEKNQTISANMDQVAIVTCSSFPPFRPKFIDRAIACTTNADILIVLNKAELGIEDEERFKLFETLGFKTIQVSAITGYNIDKLVELLKGKTTAFVGQSGVGKSTLVNRIIQPEKEQITNDVCLKYNRGRHTTNHSLLLINDDVTIIDTPGVREILVPLEDEELVKSAFPEFREECKYSKCMHIDENECAVKEDLENNLIDEDRYNSYLRIVYSLRERNPKYNRTKFRKNKQ